MAIYKTYKILQYASDKPGIYIMVEQSRMALFKTMDELSFVPVIVSDSRQLKDITLDTAIKAKDYLRERSPGVMPTTYKPPLSWLRSGFYELDIYNQQKEERGPVTAISNK
ncbi:hypothetical protein O0I10_007082 [Lichtheimia ornata]|uniref:Uncharacterized protein n=1 Tax=Lichtheimia ornata TaxID=688661 RepID=A0AAD7V404_9FUNG|nr:uncharacterized protein O0I10_007082 [Lichtheimia ornata]KAJ8657266.1 hypothetical protein O0I10_007082 [Lichtheimia ornata]